MTESELKLCPFCGDTPSILSSHNTGYRPFIIVCESCKIFDTRFWNSLEYAIEAWNTRK